MIHVRTCPVLLVFAMSIAACDSAEKAKNLFFPPDDLYRPLGEIQMSLADAGSFYSLDIAHEYPGMHGVEIRVLNPPSVGRSIDLASEVTVTVEQDGRVILSKRIKEFDFPFWDREGGGLTVLYYSVPEDLPRRQPLRFLVTVETPDAGFQERYGQAKLCIRKHSDE